MHLILRRGKNGAYLCAKCGERLLQAFAHFLFPTFPTHCYYCYISNLKILYYKIQKYIITINRCAKLGKWQRCLATMKPNLHSIAMTIEVHPSTIFREVKCTSARKLHKLTLVALDNEIRLAGINY